MTHSRLSPTESRAEGAPSEAVDAAADGAGLLVEILYFDGCPNHHPAVAMVERVSRELGLIPELRLVNVPDQMTAEELRFLGSPTIRVDGRDVDPQTDERSEYALSCRVFRTDAGIVGEPDERWVRDALLRRTERRQQSLRASVVVEREPSEVTRRALAVAGIPADRFGAARLDQLAPAERELYRWILRSFAEGGNPGVDALRAEASRLELGIDETLERLARLDLVHRDPASGEPLVAYPFSARPRGHRVLIDGEHRVEAMCAIDALGIGPMLGLPIETTSLDPISGGEVWVRLDPGDGVWWEPKEAVVLAGSACCEGPSFGGCCDVLNFFESAENAERYLSEHGEVNGFALSIPEAIEVGRVVFADLLDWD